MSNDFDSKDKYLLTLVDLRNGESRLVEVKDRTEFAKITALLIKSRYTILDLVILHSPILGEAFIKELVLENKPNDMEFGQDLTL